MASVVLAGKSLQPHGLWKMPECCGAARGGSPSRRRTPYAWLPIMGPLTGARALCPAPGLEASGPRGAVDGVGAGGPGRPTPSLGASLGSALPEAVQKPS